MDINSDQLLKFKCIAESNTLTEAAEKLAISQPALSYTLSCLEEELKTKLFDREKNKLILNEKGNELYKYSLKLNALFNEIKAEFESSGKINIHTNNIYASFLLDISPIELKNKMVFSFGAESDLPSILISHKADIVIADKLTFRNFDMNSFEKFLISKEILGVFVDSSHKFYQYDEITYKDLANEKIIYHVDFFSLNNWLARIMDFTGCKFNFSDKKGRLSASTTKSINLTSINGLYKRPIFENHFNRGEKFIKINDYDSKRLMYVWYLKNNRDKAQEVINVLKKFYLTTNS